MPEPNSGPSGGPPPRSALTGIELFVMSPEFRKVFLSGDYKEEQLRLEFLNPLFSALGWDIGETLDTILVRNMEVSLFLPETTKARDWLHPQEASQTYNLTDDVGTATKPHEPTGMRSR